MKKTLSLILALVLILSCSSILAEEMFKYKANLTKTFLVLTNEDLTNIVNVNSENNPANKIISYSFTGAFPVVDNKFDNSLAEPTDEEVEAFRADWIGSEQEAREKISFENSKKYYFPLMELGNTIDIKLSTKEKAYLNIELYDEYGLIQDISENDSNEISLSYTPTVAGMYKAKYIVDGIVVGVDETTVESSEKKSIFNYVPSYYPLNGDFGFSWFAPYIEISQKFDCEEIKIYRLKPYYYINQVLVVNPDFAREYLYSGFSFSEKLNSRLAIDTENSGIYGQFGTVERAEEYYNYLLNDAEKIEKILREEYKRK